MKQLLDKVGLAAAPALGYYFVFLHESGYCAAFGVPNSFIRPDLTTVLVVTSGLVILAPLLAPLIESFLDWDDARSERAVPRLLRLYTPAIILIAFVWTVTSWKTAAYVAGIIGGLTIMDIILAALNPADSQLKHINRLRGPFRLHEARSNRYKGRFSPGQYSLVFALFLLCSFCASIVGRGKAMNQQEFLVPSKHPDWIVVRMYGDKAIFAELNECRELTKRFHVDGINHDAVGLFETKKLGQLVQK